MVDYDIVGWFPVDEFNGEGTTFGEVVAFVDSADDGAGLGGRHLGSGDIVALCRLFNKEEAEEFHCYPGCVYSTPYMILDRAKDSALAKRAGVANIYDLDATRLLVKLRHGFSSFRQLYKS